MVKMPKKSEYVRLKFMKGISNGHLWFIQILKIF